MRLRTVVARGLILVLLVVAGAPILALLGNSAGVTEAYAQSGQTIRNIRIEGNRRVEPETVRSYLLFSPGDVYNPERVDESLKALFATGLFQDVSIRRQGSTVIIVVEENPVINQVAFDPDIPNRLARLSIGLRHCWGIPLE